MSYEVILKSGRSFLISEDVYKCFCSKKTFETIESFHDMVSGESVSICISEVAAIHKKDGSEESKDIINQLTEAIIKLKIGCHARKPWNE